MVNPPIQGAGAPVLRDSAGSVTRFTSFSTRLRRASLRGAMSLGALVFATGAWAQSADMVLSNHVVNPDPVPAVLESPKPAISGRSSSSSARRVVFRGPL